MIQALLKRRESVFALVFAWKIALFIFSVQPVPANDAFFYDGAVVNFLLHGQYVNPSLALALPISATKVFSAYPPLYQAVLLPWMFVFGTSAFSAIAFHLLLFGIYSLLLFAVLKQLKVPVWCTHVAGLFLFAITFHDRPDSLAHVFGMFAVLSWVRSQTGVMTKSSGWLWAMPVFIVLCFATSLQIGSVYFLLVSIGLLASRMALNEKLPLLPWLIMAIVPVVCVLLVVFAFPNLWAGFREHADQTPSFTGVRLPEKADVLKIIRTVPGLIASAIGLVALAPKFQRLSSSTEAVRFAVVAGACALAGVAVIVASMVVLTANMVAIADYLQPVAVGCCLASFNALILLRERVRLVTALFLALALLGSVRAIGMSTWGLACATDMGYRKSMQRVNNELANCAPGDANVISSAYLYEASRYDNLRGIHSDWLAPAKRADTMSGLSGLLALKPRKLILTEFDYYRRYEPVVAELKASGVWLQISNTATVPVPDANKSLQRVVQHISWAPVIVSFDWSQSRMEQANKDHH